MEEEHMRKKTYTKNTAVLLSDEQYDRLLWITDRLEIPLSEFIRMAVDEKMDSEIYRLKQERLNKGMNNEKGTN
jgi:predicted DNA-binding protein